MSKPIGPYAPILQTGEWFITSGQIGLHDGELVSGGLEAELIQTFKNLKALLTNEGLTLRNIVKTTVFLVDIDDYQLMNTIYIQEFGSHRPTRSAVAVTALPLGAVVEIEAWARIEIADQTASAHRS
ncbi:deaminase [bacterium]|nr:deaminase [bacterium]|tara:strand:- start:877 stop:1257 length:381 start_codon:yes stop_codon:yes gene_type:complete